MSKTKMYDKNEYIVLYDDEENYKLELSTIKETCDFLGRCHKLVLNAIKNHTKIKSKIDGKVYYIHRQRNCVLKNRSKKPISSKIKYLDNENRVGIGKDAREKLGSKLQVDVYENKVIITKAKEEE